MFGKDRNWPAATLAGGLVALAVLVGCGGQPSVASRSAAAFEEAQKKGKTFEGSGHSHGHGAMTPGGAGQEESAAGDDHGQHDQGQAEAAHDHAAMEQSGAEHGGHDSHASRAQRDEHAGHAAQSGHSEHAAQDPHAGHDMSPQNPPASGHEGHSMDHDEMDHDEMDHGEMDHGEHGEMAPDTAEAPAAVPPGQPAKTLSPDALDAPAATSIVDAQRSAEMAEEMSGGGGHGGHGGHGTGMYKQIDAGRGPEAHEGSEPRTPGHEDHQHGTDEAAAVYTCPMHPEVTSAEPGKCPKCGMALKRRKG